MPNNKGPLTPFHMTSKVSVTLNGKEVLMLAQDSGAVSFSPENELADVAEGMQGDTETVITESFLSTQETQCMATSPTLRDAKPKLAKKTLEEGGYPAEVVDANESSRFSASCDRAVLLQQLNKERGGRSLNAETIASQGVFQSSGASMQEALGQASSALQDVGASGGIG